MLYSKTLYQKTIIRNKIIKVTACANFSQSNKANNTPANNLNNILPADALHIGLEFVDMTTGKDFGVVSREDVLSGAVMIVIDVGMLTTVRVTTVFTVAILLVAVV